MKREDIVKKILQNRTINTIKPGVLKVAAYANFYPVCYKNNGAWKGLDVDIMKSFCKYTGLKLQLTEKKHFDNIWLEPPKGKADTAIGGIGISDKRTKAKTAWSIPYFYVYRTVVYNKSNPIHTFPNDVDGEVRGTVGSTGWIDAKKKLKKANKSKYLKKGKTDVQDINDLLAGEIQGLIRGSFVGLALTKKYKQLGMAKPWEIDESLVSSDGECFAYPCHRDSGLAEMLSTYITLMFMNGTLNELLQKYNLK